MRLFLQLSVVIAVLAAGVFVGLRVLSSEALVVAAWKGTATDAVPGTVSVRAESTFPIASEIGGRIARSTLQVGKSVKAGDVLIELDATTLKIEIEQARNDLNALKTRIERGSPQQFALAGKKQNLEYQKYLFESGSLPKARYDDVVRDVASTEHSITLETDELNKQLNSLKSSLALKEAQLEKMTLHAPFDGVITRILAKEDQLVGGWQTIAELISSARIVEARIAEEHIAGVQVGQNAIVRLSGYAGDPFQARVAQKLPAADPETQRYTLYLDVDAPEEKLIPGLTGEALITLAERKDAVLIPRAALNSDSVLVVVDGRRVQQRRPQIGFTSMNQVEILDGVAEGELVIIDELDRFRDGDRVRATLAEPDGTVVAR